MHLNETQAFASYLGRHCEHLIYLKECNITNTSFHPLPKHSIRPTLCKFVIFIRMDCFVIQFRNMSLYSNIEMVFKREMYLPNSFWSNKFCVPDALRAKGFLICSLGEWSHWQWQRQRRITKWVSNCYIENGVATRIVIVQSFVKFGPSLYLHSKHSCCSKLRIPISNWTDLNTNIFLVISQLFCTNSIIQYINM